MGGFDSSRCRINIITVRVVRFFHSVSIGFEIETNKISGDALYLPLAGTFNKLYDYSENRVKKSVELKLNKQKASVPGQPGPRLLHC